MMKLLTILTTLTVSLASLGQVVPITYETFFSDRANLEILTRLGNKHPKRLFVLDSTESWNPNRFWHPNFDKFSKDSVRKTAEYSEHHFYNHTYLFIKPAIDSLITDSAKMNLRLQAEQTVSKRISYKSSKVTFITSLKGMRGFYFILAEPLYSRDGKYAFLDVSVHYGVSSDFAPKSDYFGTIAAIYQFISGTGWTLAYRKDHLIL